MRTRDVSAVRFGVAIHRRSVIFRQTVAIACLIAGSSIGCQSKPTLPPADLSLLQAIIADLEKTGVRDSGLETVRVHIDLLREQDLAFAEKLAEKFKKIQEAGSAAAVKEAARAMSQEVRSGS